MGIFDRIKDFFGNKKEEVVQQEDVQQVDAQQVDVQQADVQQGEVPTEAKKDEIVFKIPDSKLLLTFDYWKVPDNQKSTFYYDIKGVDGQKIDVSENGKNFVVFSKDDSCKVKISDLDEDGKLLEYRKNYGKDKYLDITCKFSNFAYSHPCAIKVCCGKDEKYLLPQKFLGVEIPNTDLEQIIKGAEREAERIFREEVKSYNIEIPKEYLNQTSYEKKSDSDDFLLLYNLESSSIHLKDFNKIVDKGDKIELVYPESFYPNESVMLAQEWLASPERKRQAEIINGAKIANGLENGDFIWHKIPIDRLFLTQELRKSLDDSVEAAKILFTSMDKEPKPFEDKVYKMIKDDVELQFGTGNRADGVKKVRGKCKFSALRSVTYVASNNFIKSNIEGVCFDKKSELAITCENGDVIDCKMSDFNEFRDVINKLNRGDIPEELHKKYDITIAKEDKEALKYAIGEDGRGAIVFSGLNTGFEARVICNNIKEEQDGSLNINITLFPPQKIKEKNNSEPIKVFNVSEFNDVLAKNREKVLGNSVNKVNLKAKELGHNNENERLV